MVWSGVLRQYFQHGETALMLAAEEGRKHCVQLLLDAGADKNATNMVRAGCNCYVNVLCALICTLR